MLHKLTQSVGGLIHLMQDPHIPLDDRFKFG